jgi:hypothetical protein
MHPMTRKIFALLLLFLLSALAAAAPLSTNTRNVIPKDVQQIISVDYRALRASETALALKERVLPDPLKEFESAIRSLGIEDRDIEQLTFASFRTKEKGVRIVGIGQGQFERKAIVRRMRLKKIRPTKYRTDSLYPVAGGLEMAFLDDFTILFGEPTAIRIALDARDGEQETLNSNSQVLELVNAVVSGPVWSVLDAAGTQNMMRSALGEATKLADYETVKKRLIGSRYLMDFSSGVAFDLEVMTADSMTAAALSSLVKAGMMYKRLNATGTEKLALDSVSVDSESDQLKLHFRTDDKKFQALLQSELFAAVSR